MNKLADMARLNLKVVAQKGMVDFVDGRFTPLGVIES
jgi:hypothetical protein